MYGGWNYTHILGKTKTLDGPDAWACAHMDACTPYTIYYIGFLVQYICLEKEYIYKYTGVYTHNKQE